MGGGAGEGLESYYDWPSMYVSLVNHLQVPAQPHPATSAAAEHCSPTKS